MHSLNLIFPNNNFPFTVINKKQFISAHGKIDSFSLKDTKCATQNVLHIKLVATSYLFFFTLAWQELQGEISV